MAIFDFESLKEQGIEQIPLLAQGSWTDFNPSDPGITLLEQLCYALTDLGYRIDFEMPDLLAAGGDAAYSALFSPRQVLTNDPVTIADYRKIFLDLVNVKNAAVRLDSSEETALSYAPFSQELLLAKDQDALLPEDLYEPVVLKGLMEIQAEPNPSLTATTDLEALQTAIVQQGQQFRSLCTDLSQVTVLDRQSVSIQLSIELNENADPEALLPLIWEKLDQYVSPILNFYDLTSFLQDKSRELAFEGPALTHGFLSSEEMQQFQKRTDLRRSDVIRTLTEIQPQIKAVRELSLLQGSGYSWVVSLNPDLAPFFDLQNTSVRFWRGELSVVVDPARVNQLKQAYLTAQRAKLEKTLSSAVLDLLPARGNDREVGQYTSLRLHMPELFGVSAAGLPPEANLTQEASVKQLSAYLMFFEQILANAFTQLAEAWRLFSVARSDTQSYFTHVPDSLPATQDLFSEPNPGLRSAQVQAATESPASQSAFARTHRFLDHMMARFSESMRDYNLLMNGLSGPGTNAPAVIADKRRFLQEYPTLSSTRARAFDYSGPTWNTENISGMTRRIGRLLGIDDLNRQNLSGGGEGFFVLEHILMRPRPGDTFQNGPLLVGAPLADPYSLQLSFVFAEQGRFTSSSVKNYAAQLVRAETPAHLQVYIYWLSGSDLAQFENAYQAFLQALSGTGVSASIADTDHQFALRASRDQLLDVMAQLNIAGSFGLAYPLRDLPLPAEVSAVQVDVINNEWQAAIPIPYAQSGVVYVLTDRNRIPVLDPNTSNRIEKSGDVPDGIDGQGRPYILLNTPDDLTETQTYYIRAEKNLGGQLRFVYLAQAVRVRIGIVPINIQVVNQEINYGETNTLVLLDTQAGVDYRLFDQSGTEISVSPQQVAGNAASPVNFLTPALYEDQAIHVRGSRDNFASSQEVGISSPIRVRANPDLILLNAAETINFGANVNGTDLTIAAQASPGPGNPYAQASVNYALYQIEIPDRAFVHQKAPASQPPATEVVEITPTSLSPVRIERPDTSSLPSLQASASLIATATVSSDGDALNFGSGTFALQEDTMYLIVASKPGHTTPVVLHDPSTNKIHIAASLVYPDPSPTVVLNPDPVSSGSQARVLIGGGANPAQAGVFYFLRIGAADQRRIFHHDLEVTSVRRDGIGFSKVAVDNVVGPVAPVPLSVFTDASLSATIQADVVAEKAQTGMQVVLTGGTNLNLTV